jgi:hypothetical protein
MQLDFKSSMLTEGIDLSSETLLNAEELCASAILIVRVNAKWIHYSSISISRHALAQCSS